MGLQPLAIAGFAAALLVGVLAVDATMNQTYSLEVWNGTAWSTLAQAPHRYDDVSRPYPASPTLAVNASEEVRFRLRADNTYWWSGSASYSAYVGPTQVAEGTLALPARQGAVAEFTVLGSTLLSPHGGLGPPRDETGLVGSNVEVRVDGETLYGSLSVREVRA